MRVAIFAARGASVPDLSVYIPRDATEILTSGAGAAGLWARSYARELGLPLRVFAPERDPSGRFDYAGRDARMVEAAERAILLLNGNTRSMRRVLRLCAGRGVSCCLVDAEG